MNIDLLIAGTSAGLALIALYLRTNVSLAVLGAGIGYVLADLTTNGLVGSLVAIGWFDTDLPLNSIVAISLTVIPSLMILVRFRRFQPGRFLEHIFPAVFLGLLLTLLVLLQLPFDVQTQLEQDSYVFTQFQYFRSAIVGGAAIIAIYDVMAHEQKLKKKGKKGLFGKKGGD
jgi:hypothetical protein